MLHRFGYRVPIGLKLDDLYNFFGTAEACPDTKPFMQSALKVDAATQVDGSSGCASDQTG